MNALSQRHFDHGANRASARVLSTLTLLLAAASVLRAQEFLDRLDDLLFLETPGGLLRVDLSGALDFEGYYIDQRPPGLIFSNDRFFFNPRATFFLDARLGKHIYSFAQARVDRGFDPGLEPDGQARFDEYFLRYTPLANESIHVQAGKFATVVGNFVPRHHAWDNPFINAPLPYENVVTITDQAVPPSPMAALGRKARADMKATWVPLVWGPSYAAGASVFGSLHRFDYAVEVKNAAISSRPEAWDPFDLGWEHPTVSGRVGVRPGTAWNLGLSASGGSYLLPVAERDPAFPTGDDRGDFRQITVAHDVSWAWRRWQFWGEVFLSRFEVPNVGDADTVAYYIETKYKFTAQLFGAVRWNQQFFDCIRDGAGGRASWDNDVWRVDSALGWRFTRHIQAKAQYSYSHHTGSLQQGEQLAATQLTIRF